MSLNERREYEDKTGIFEDRRAGTLVLSEMLEPYRGSDAIILGITLGGLTVGAMLAERLSLPLDAAPIGKISVPWNPDSGFGAVAFDGTVKLHEGLIKDLGLLEPDISKGREEGVARLKHLMAALGLGASLPSLEGRAVILADDAVVSSITMATAVEAIRRGSHGSLVVAVPTGYRFALNRLAEEVDEVYCPNVRGGWGFAPEGAYKHWTPATEGEARSALSRFAD